MPVYEPITSVSLLVALNGVNFDRRPFWLLYSSPTKEGVMTFRGFFLSQRRAVAALDRLQPVFGVPLALCLYDTRQSAWKYAASGFAW